jgi:opacity protein-like surface antigen
MSGAMGSKQAARTTTGTTIMRRFVTARLLTILGGAAILLGLAGRAEAQEIQLTGPLAGAPAVRHERLFREGRFEIAPTVSFTLLDEYRRTIFLGGRLQYNVTDWFGFGLWGAYGAVQIDTNLTTEIDQTAPRNIVTAVNINHTLNPTTGAIGPSNLANNTNTFSDQVAKWNWVLAPQVQLTPFRGKLSIFEKIFVDTDAYLFLGLAFNGIQERGNCGDGVNNDPICILPQSFALQSRVALAPTFGIGLHFFVADFMSLGVEYRAIPFSWDRAGFDVSGGPNGFPALGEITSADRTFKFNQMISVEVGFGLPAKPSVSD